jgi:hypothetical protein
MVGGGDKTGFIALFCPIPAEKQRTANGAQKFRRLLTPTFILIV